MFTLVMQVSGEDSSGRQTLPSQMPVVQVVASHCVGGLRELVGKQAYESTPVSPLGTRAHEKPEPQLTPSEGHLSMLSTTASCVFPASSGTQALSAFGRETQPNPAGHKVACRSRSSRVGGNML